MAKTVSYIEYESEPDVLEYEVRFAIKVLANGTTPVDDEIPIELLKVLKEDAIKILATEYERQHDDSSDWENLYLFLYRKVEMLRTTPVIPQSLSSPILAR